MLDCRRRPRSRVPDWNAGRITALLAVQAPGVVYTLRGEDLGGYPPGTEIPDPPPPVSEDALNSLQGDACVSGHRMLLICAEKAPGECHRHITIGLPLARKAKAESMWWPDDVEIRHVYQDKPTDPIELIEPMELQASIDEDRDYECEVLEDDRPDVVVTSYKVAFGRDELCDACRASAAEADARGERFRVCASCHEKARQRPPLDRAPEQDDAPAELVRYHYSMQGASLANENRHPQLVIREHFPDAAGFEPHPIGECWLFRAAAREGVPSFFVRLPDAPEAPPSEDFRGGFPS